jgi:cupin fold WbuC family metalloprotein
VLRGRVDVLIFDGDGTLTQRHAAGEGTDLIAFETPPNTWHTLVSAAPGSLLLEVKQGPYDPATAVEFAPWAPPEGVPEARELLEKLRTAVPGQSIPK